jgi:7-carboxy-7-deazaguanine synthase
VLLTFTMTIMAINSIFRSTEGEGIHLGTPQIFVRFQGCNIGCVNCDTKETWEFTEPNMTLNQVLSEIEKLRGDKARKVNRVSITGGDPLHPKHTDSVIALVKELKRKKMYVHIEAAGTRVVHEIFDLVDFISMDYKTPSTGVKTNLNLLTKFIEQYPHTAQIKSVIANKHDFENTYNALVEIEAALDRPIMNWVLTPCFEPGEELPVDRIHEIVALNEEYGAPFRVITQQHKILHGPDRAQV